MSFAFSDDQKAIAELAGQIIGGACHKDVLDKIEAGGGFFHEALWSSLVESGLVGIAVPESAGGGGLGLVEACLLAIETGKHVAPIPVADTIVVGAPALAASDNPQAQAALKKVLSGKGVISCAWLEKSHRDERHPGTLALQTDDGWRIHGIKTCATWFDHAAGVLLTAKTDDAVGLFWVEKDADGLAPMPQKATDNQPLHALGLDDVAAIHIGDSAAANAALDRAALARCAEQLGIATMALKLTADHCRTREQFGMPIGMFQAVSQRTGDMYIDTQAMQLTFWQAGWLLATGRDAADALLVARYWASEAGHRVVVAAQHLHGGTGFDTDYPLHRCFRRMRRLELGIGTARETLHTLGERIAAA